MSQVVISKVVTQTYRIRFEKSDKWADINIVPDDSGRGFLIQIASDYGGWSNYWNAPGGGITAFLNSINIDYAAGKFGAGKWIDTEKTIASAKSTVLEHRRKDELHADTARAIFNELKEIEGADGQSVVHMLWSCENYLGFVDHRPEIIETIHPLFQRFWDEVWVHFVQHLKQESNGN